MKVADWLFVLVIVCAAISTLVQISRYVARRGKFGKILWAAPPEGRWLSVLLMVVCASAAVASAFTGSGRDLTRWLAFSLTFIVWFVITGVAQFLPGGKCTVMDGGITFGLLILNWGELTGWSFGPGKSWDEKAGMVSMQLSAAGPDRRILYIWTRSRWQFFYNLTPSRPIKSSFPYSPELESLLTRYAPSVNRSAPVKM